MNHNGANRISLIVLSATMAAAAGESDVDRKAQVAKFNAWRAPLVINDDRHKPLKLVLTRPWYRNTIFTSLPVQTIKVEAYPSVGIAPGLAIGSRLELKIEDEQGHTLASNTIKDLSLTFLIRGEVDVRDLPPGEYRVVARMINSAGEPLENVHGYECVDSVPLRKLPPAPHEVVLDENGICRVNGKAVFPIGIYWICPVIRNEMNSVRVEKGLAPLDWRGWFTKLKKAGFNSFMGGQGGLSAEELGGIFTTAMDVGLCGQWSPELQGWSTTRAMLPSQNT